MNWNNNMCRVFNLNSKSRFLLVILTTFFSSALFALPNIILRYSDIDSLSDTLFVIPGTTRLICDDYILNETVFFAQENQDTLCDSIYVRYLTLSEKLLNGVYLFEPVGIGDIPIKPKLFERTPYSEFEQAGSISRGFRIGTNKDFSVQSDFNFEASGKIGKDLEIRAVLSDRASPIQPEGRSQTLSELDRVYIEAVHPNFDTRFGDIDLITKGSRFLSISKSVKGISGGVHYDPAGIMASGAVMRGEKYSNNFTGTEGNQGPYKIKDKKGNSNITIIAGTEQVWVDGELKKRGERNDYIIDYNLAEIEFMSSTIITSNSRIVVDFEYASEEYQSSLYFAEAYINANKYFKLTANGYFANDNKENPIGFDLSDDDIENLQLLGDLPDSAFIDGWTEDTLGDYVFAADSSYKRILIYVGNNSIDSVNIPDGFTLLDTTRYNSVFSSVENGEYLKTDSFYTYSDSGGNWAPIKNIDLPVSLNVISIHATSDSSFPFYADLEMASSSYDRNTFSYIDDEDNIGYAGALKLVSPKISDFLNIGYDYYRKDINYIAPDRINPADFDRDWGFSGTDKKIGTTIHSGNINVNKTINKTSYKSNFELGYREDTDNKDAIRYLTDIALKNNVQNINVKYRRNLVNIEENEKTIDNLTSNITSTLGQFNPSVNFEFHDENNQTYDDSIIRSSGERYYDFSSSIDYKFAKNWSFVPQGGYRLDQKRDSLSLKDYSSAYYAGFKLNSRKYSLFYNHRKFFANNPDAGADLSTDMLDMTVSLNGRKPQYSLRVNYKITGAMSEDLERVYEYVGTGNGDYIIDETASDGFILNSDGDYILKYIGSGNFTPTTDLETSLRYSLSSKGLLPESVPGTFRLDGNISSTQSVSERSSKGFWIQLQKFDNDTTILKGMLRFDSSILWKIGKASIRVGEKYYNSVNRTWTSGDEFITQNSQYIETDFGISNIRLGLRGDYDKKIRQYPESTTREPSNIQTSKITSENSWKINNTFTPMVTVQYYLSENKPSEYDITLEDFDAEGIVISPSLKVALGKGSIDFKTSWTKLETSGLVGIIPYDMAGGKYAGENYDWSLRAVYKFSENSIESISWVGKKYPDQEAEHTFEAKIQYLF